MRLPFIFLLASLFALVSACSTPYNLSGTIEPLTAPPSTGGGMTMGVLADSQLQSLPAWHVKNTYRSTLGEKMTPVTIRPPALDWSSRSMMINHLKQLQYSKAEAIFYLGDGANHGCEDEVSSGLEQSLDQRNDMSLRDQGVLTILDSFRQSSGIPIFFIIGNHDFLGAGNTSDRAPRESLCGKFTDKPSRALSKLDLIQIVDSFNRANNAIAPQWKYKSNISELRCPKTQQHRAWGCYLAATVSLAKDAENYQFLLLDTNDYPDVSKEDYLGNQFYGLRGAMSFGAVREGIVSQTSWFDENASDLVDMRIALSHYDIPSLRKSLPLVGKISRKSQQFTTLFTGEPPDREELQNDVYVISAHTHLAKERKPSKFAVNCNFLFCKPSGKRFLIQELNIDSTTDHPNQSAVVTVHPSNDNQVGNLEYQRVSLNQSKCSEVIAELNDYEFNLEQTQSSGKGLLAVGIDVNNRHNYQNFSETRARSIFNNLENFAGSDITKASCIGILAASIEANKGNPF